MAKVRRKKGIFHWLRGTAASHRRTPEKPARRWPGNVRLWMLQLSSWRCTGPRNAGPAARVRGVWRCGAYRLAARSAEPPTERRLAEGPAQRPRGLRGERSAALHGERSEPPSERSGLEGFATPKRPEPREASRLLAHLHAVALVWMSASLRHPRKAGLLHELRSQRVRAPSLALRWAQACQHRRRRVAAYSILCWFQNRGVSQDGRPGHHFGGGTRQSSSSDGGIQQPTKSQLAQSSWANVVHLLVQAMREEIHDIAMPPFCRRDAVRTARALKGKRKLYRSCILLAVDTLQVDCVFRMFSVTSESSWRAERWWDLGSCE